MGKCPRNKGCFFSMTRINTVISQTQKNWPSFLNFQYFFNSQKCFEKLFVCFIKLSNWILRYIDFLNLCKSTLQLTGGRAPCRQRRLCYTNNVIQRDHPQQQPVVHNNSVPQHVMTISLYYPLKHKPSAITTLPPWRSTYPWYGNSPFECNPTNPMIANTIGFN